MWDKITVEQYQAINRIQKQAGEDIDKLLSIIGVVYNLSDNQVNDLPITRYHKMVAEIEATFLHPLQPSKPKKFIRAARQTYKLQHTISLLRYGQWVELQHFFKSGIIENLHLIAASISVPVRCGIPGKNRSEDHEKKATHFLAANFMDLYSSVVFFCSPMNGLKKDTRDYLTRKAKEIQMKEMKEDSASDQMDSLTALNGSIQQPKFEIMKELS